jgi:hypothetical protein
MIDQAPFNEIVDRPGRLAIGAAISAAPGAAKSTSHVARAKLRMHSPPAPT